MANEPKKPLTYAEMVAIAEAHGFKQAPPDHPIFRLSCVTIRGRSNSRRPASCI